MKKEDVFMGLAVVFIIALIVIPLPALLLKILYFVDCVFAVGILCISLISIFRKKQPGFFAVLFLFFALFTLAMYMSTTKSVLLFVSGDGQQTVSLVSGIRSSLFEQKPAAGYFLTVFALMAETFGLCMFEKVKDETLTGVVKFFRGAVKAEILIFIVSVLSGSLIGLKMLDLSFMEALKNCAPLCCSQFILYLVPTIFGIVGIGILPLADLDFKLFSRKKK